MAIYNPPKTNNWGEALQVAGTTAAGVGGAVAMTGAGAIPGAIIGALGAATAGIGSIISKNQQRKVQEYESNYQARLQSENTLQASITNIKKMANINL